MIFIHSLRMIADLSVYFFLAELAVIQMGGSSQFVQFLLLGLCYGVMVSLQNSNFSKIYMALPLLVLFVPGSTILAILPPVIYILYLIYNENTKLTWDRQFELFSISIKFFPLAGVFICFLGKYANFIQYALPMVFISLATSVFLMRMLRQPPAVYMDPQYQRKNCSLFLVVVLTGWLCSRDFAFKLIGGAMSFVYMKAIYPVLNVFIYLFMGILKLLMYIFSWFKLGEIKFEENHLSGGDMGPTFKDAVVVGDHVASTETILTALVIIALLICAFYFFRWLALHKGEDSFISYGFDMIRSKDSTKPKKERATTTVMQVRRQYRQFLKLYRENGGKIENSFTSEDVMNHSAEVLAETSPDVLSEMRQIYLAARYGGIATKADLKRMKQINKELSAKNS